MIKAKEKGHFHVQSEPIRQEAQFGSTWPNVCTINFSFLSLFIR